MTGHSPRSKFSKLNVCYLPRYLHESIGYQCLSYYAKQTPFLRHTLQGVHTSFRKTETCPRDQILHRGRDEHFARPSKRRYPRRRRGMVRTT